MSAKKKKIVGCWIVIFIAVFLIVVMLIPALNNAREEARRISCASNLISIGLSLQQYAMDYDGHFPERNGAAGLDQLRVNAYLTDYKIYACPSTTNTGNGNGGGEVVPSYVYCGGLTEDDSPDSAIMWDKPGNHKDCGNVLYRDGHLKIFYGKDWVKNTKSISKNAKYGIVRSKQQLR